MTGTVNNSDSSTPAVEVLDSYGALNPAFVQIRGQVQNPGAYPFYSGATPQHYLQRAGGPLGSQPVQNLMLVRSDGKRKRALEFSLHDGRAPHIAGGDILVFHAIVPINGAFQGSWHTAPKVRDPRTREVRSIEVAPFTQTGSLPRELSEYIRTKNFRRLMNRVLQAQAETGLKSISLLSQYAGEGKTFLSNALALGYAKYLNSRVLILDTKRQTSGQKLYIERVLGEHFAEEDSKEEKFNPAFIDRLSTRCSGEQRVTTESIDFHIGPYLHSIRDRYDLIVVDTCALDEVSNDTTDPIIIAGQVDSNILVTSSKSLARDTMKRVKRELAAHRVALLGSVYNERS